MSRDVVELSERDGFGTAQGAARRRSSDGRDMVVVVTDTSGHSLVTGLHKAVVVVTDTSGHSLVTGL
jgi:hypothetical protein